MSVSLFLKIFKNSFLDKLVCFKHREKISFSYLTIFLDMFSILSVSFSINKLVNLKVEISFLIFSNIFSAFAASFCDLYFSKYPFIISTFCATNSLSGELSIISSSSDSSISSLSSDELSSGICSVLNSSSAFSLTSKI